MVLFLLYVKAELEGVQKVTLRRDANLCLTVKNPLSDFEVREKVVMNPSEPVPQEEGARGSPFHLGLKWEGTKKMSTGTILTDSEAKTALKKKKNVTMKEAYTAEDSGNFVPLLALECRGLEPTAFYVMDDNFVVTTEGGVDFNEDVDFSEGDWGDYDADNDQAVGLSDIEFKWENA